jgi:hypothetical protein
MLRLQVTANDGTRHVLDLYENAPVNLNYLFADLHDVTQISSSYSQTFRIPATDVNQALFGPAENANTYPNDQGYYQNKWSAKRKLDAQLTYDSIPLVTGYIQFKKAYITNRVHAEYEIVFFGETSLVGKAIGDARLVDLDWSGYDHQPTSTNISASWAGTLFTGDIRYALIDRGQSWSFSYQNTSTFETGIFCTEMTPCIRIKAVLDKIMATAGYTYTSDWIATMSNVYLPIMGPVDRLFGDRVVDYGMQLNFAGIGTGFNTIDLSDFSSYDLGSTWNNVGHFWTAPFACEITLTIEYSFTVTGPSGQARIAIKDTNSNTYYWFPDWVAVGQSTDQTVDVTFQIPAGESWKMVALCPGAETLSSLNCSVTMKSLYHVDTGYNGWLGQNMPDMKQLDFLKSLQKSFNLVIVPDTNKPNHVYIETWNDYIGSGITKDWSGKIDYSKDVTIEPTTTLQKKWYEWSHADSPDLVNTQVKNSLQRTWGRHRILDTENDFAVGEMKVTTEFAPFVTSYIPNSDYVIHRSLTPDGAAVKNPKPMLAYWNGTATGALTLKTATGNTSLASYPVFTNWSSYPVELDDQALTFGNDQAFHAGVELPLETLWYKYWRNHFTELYSVDSRMMTAHVFLTGADINQFRFSDKIYIRDAYYRVHTISNFSANEIGPCAVTFVKLLEPKRDCDYIPASIDSDTGVVTFTDSNDETSTGNRLCCEKYGFVWLNNRCMNVSPGRWQKPGPSTDLSSFENATAEINGILGDIETKTDLITITSPLDLDDLASDVNINTTNITSINAVLDTIRKTFRPKSATETSTRIVYEGDKFDGMSFTLNQTEGHMSSASGRTSMTMSENSPGVFQLDLQDQLTTPGTSTAIYATGNSSGNRVGINNTSPSATLDVTGSFRASGNATINGNVNGRNMSADGSKLDGIQALAEVNQLAFSNISVGGSTIPANTKTATFTLVAGTNVTLTPNVAGRSITIDAAGGGAATTDESDLFMFFFEK